MFSLEPIKRSILLTWVSSSALMPQKKTEFLIIEALHTSFWASPVAQQWRICLQYKRHRRFGFNPWVRKIPWRRAWQPIPVFLPGKCPGQRSLEGSVHRVTKSRTQLKKLCTHMHTYIVLSLWKQFKWHQAVCPYISVHFNCVIAAHSFRAVETSGVRQLNHPHFADRGSNAQGASVTCFIQNHIDSWWVSAQCLFCHTALLASQNFRA